jgi:hypothetical protein
LVLCTKKNLATMATAHETVFQIFKLDF